jgi:hypothetical protein
MTEELSSAHSLHHLEKLGALTEDEGAALRDYVSHGKLPAEPAPPQATQYEGPVPNETGPSLVVLVISP